MSEDLIARLEKATRGERELDGWIDCVMSGRAFVQWDGAGAVWRNEHGNIHHIREAAIPAYTGSIDAALTLVPDGMQVGIQGPWVHRETGRQIWYAAVANAIEDYEGNYDDKGATPAIALTIACLRARATQEK